MDTHITVGVTREKMVEMVAELQECIEKPGKHFEHTFYCKPNGRGLGDEVTLAFSNDDMEADVNPDIDGSHAYIDIDLIS